MNLDLHTHSLHSDGTYSPATVVRNAALRGVELLALTDHDTISGVAEAQAAGKRWGVTVLPGVEVTTQDHHILCLNFEKDNVAMRALLRKSIAYRTEKATRHIEALASAGFPITMEKVLANFPDSPVGQWKYIMTLRQDPACARYLRERQLIRYHSLRSIVKNHEPTMPASSYVHLDDTIHAAHEAKGIAIIAHPFSRLGSCYELAGLLERGLDGMEIQPHQGTRNTPYENYAHDNDLLITYGSDYHGATHPDRPLLQTSRASRRLLEKLELTPITPVRGHVEEPDMQYVGSG